MSETIVDSNTVLRFDSFTGVLIAQDKLEKVNAYTKKLESALRFYADENTWNICGEWEMDKGAKALKALTIDEVGESKSYEYNQYFQNMTKEGLLDMIESYLKYERRLK